MRSAWLKGHLGEFMLTEDVKDMAGNPSAAQSVSNQSVPNQSVSNPPLAATPNAPEGKRRRRVLLAIVTLCIVALALAAWWMVGRKNEPTSYTTALVSRGAVVKAVTATGTVNPVLTIMVGTYVSGVIQELTCDFNTRVKKGQLCAKIDPRPYQTVVDQDRAAVGMANAQLEKDRANLAYAKLTYQRGAAMLQEGIVSQDVFDSAKSAYDQLLSQIGVDQSTIAQRQAELNTAEVNLEYTNIRSPVDGTVVQRNVTMGQTVAASFQTPTLFLIAKDLTEMQVDTNVSESDMGNLRDKDKASFTVEAFPARTFEGTVVQVRQAPQSIQNVVTYDIVVGFKNRDLALKPGMTATVRIVTDERSGVLRVPDQALRYTPGGSGAMASAAGGANSTSTGRANGSSKARGQVSGDGAIWILRNGAPQRVEVKLGLDDDSFTEIVGGDVAAGDAVIVSEQSADKQQKTGSVSMPLRF